MSGPEPASPDDRHAAFQDGYFRKWNYADRGRGRFSMYWFARRYYAALVRRYAPRDHGALLEIGCGEGDLLSLLQDDFKAVGIDVIPEAVERTRRIAPRAEARLQDGEELGAFASGAFSAVVSLHVVEHLADPAAAIGEVSRLLKPGGVFVFATPQPDYAMRRFKDRANDAIGKDLTHINVQPPAVWRGWCDAAGLDVVRHFADGLWDVPYLPVIPAKVQFAFFGLPALAQVLTRTTLTPLSMGVNQILIARKR